MCQTKELQNPIRVAMTSKGWSHSEMARLLGVSSYTLRDLLRGATLGASKRFQEALDRIGLDGAKLAEDYIVWRTSIAATLDDSDPGTPDASAAVEDGQPEDAGNPLFDTEDDELSTRFLVCVDGAVSRNGKPNARAAVAVELIDLDGNQLYHDERFLGGGITAPVASILAIEAGARVAREFGADRPWTILCDSKYAVEVTAGDGPCKVQAALDAREQARFALSLLTDVEVAWRGKGEWNAFVEKTARRATQAGWSAPRVTLLASSQ